MADNAIAVVLVLIAVGGLFVFRNEIFGWINSFAPNIIAWIQDLLRDIGYGGDVRGGAWISYTVTYSDGSIQTFNDNPPFSLMWLSINVQSKTVSSIRMDVKAKLNGDDLTDWNSETTVSWKFYRKPDTQNAKASYTDMQAKSGYSWIDGETKTLASVTLSATQLSNVVQTYGDGWWLLQSSAQINLETLVGGVNTEFDPTEAQSGIEFLYDDDVPLNYSVSAGYSVFAP